MTFLVTMFFICNFARKSKKKMNQRLGIVEFEDVLFNNISDLILSAEFLKKNNMYWESIVNDLFNYYYYSQEEVSIKALAKTIEVLISNNIVYNMKF